MEESTLLHAGAQNPPFPRTLTHPSQDRSVTGVHTGFRRRSPWPTYLCVRICVSAASCSSGRSCRTGRRRTCRSPSSSSSSSGGPSPSRSAPPGWTRPLSPGPASPPGGREAHAVSESLTGSDASSCPTRVLLQNEKLNHLWLSKNITPIRSLAGNTTTGLTYGHTYRFFPSQGR